MRLRSTTVQSEGSEGSTGRSIRELLEDARRSMKVRGRDAMASGGDELYDDGADIAEAPSEESAISYTSMPSRDSTCRKMVKEDPVSRKEVRAAGEAASEAEICCGSYTRLVEHVEDAAAATPGWSSTCRARWRARKRCS